MKELIVKGTQKFSGRNIPVVLGGFGEDKKCMSDKTIAEIHNQPEREIRRRITENIKRFKENVDFIDLKQRVGESHTSVLLIQMGYSKQAITQAEHIYILSERGYAKLIKIMDTDLAWEIHDKLIDEYFQFRENVSSQIPVRESRTKRVPLSSVNNTVKFMAKLYQDAGADPTYIALAASKVYKDEADLNFEVPLISKEENIYDKTTMAEMLGVFSINGKPHPQYIGAIISYLDITDEEVVNTPYTNHGHSGVDVQYKQSVYEKVEKWLIAHNYPESLKSNDNGKCLKARFSLPIDK